MNAGEWTEEWLRVAEIGNQIRQNYDLAEDWNELELLQAESALSNPFYEEISSLYEQLSLDQMDAGDNPLVLAGRSIALGAASYDFSQMLGSESSLLVGATESLSIDGLVEVLGTPNEGARMVLASGGSIEVTNGTNLKSALSDLVVSAREDVLMSGVALESAREVAIRSLRDLQLNQLTINAPDRVRITAARDLDVDGLQLSQSLPSLIMEATTIRLRNIDFPAATAVQLNSLKGPIDGRYPNFGTGIPLDQQLGRVNFIENVRSEVTC